MIGLLNGFLGLTEFFESIADSFLGMFDILNQPIENSFTALSLLDTVSLFPTYVWGAFIGLLTFVTAMVIIKLLNYLPLW